MANAIPCKEERSLTNPIRVTIWNEGRHEQTHDAVKAVYPDGMHSVIADYLNSQPGITARWVTQDMPEHGLTDEVLANTDVMTWWGHVAHGEVDDAIVEKVVQRVWEGMGIIFLHSAHFSKPFKRLMGTSCQLKWREANEKERLWVVDPSHPIAAGLGDYFELPHEEMYGEMFDIPAPDALVFISWFKGGEVFRSGCCYSRGKGKVFYFRPGHETHPTYFDANVQRVIGNAVRWATPPQNNVVIACPCYPALEPLDE
jgi:trehalose utilization protein